MLLAPNTILSRYSVGITFYFQELPDGKTFNQFRNLILFNYLFILYSYLFCSSHFPLKTKYRFPLLFIFFQ